MIARSLILAVCVAVLLPGLPRAQETSPPRGVTAAAADSTADRKMYEDIEILRRILDRKLHTLYPPSVTPSTQYPLLVNPNLQGGMLGMQGGMIGLQGGRMGMDTMGSTMFANPVYTQQVSYKMEGVYLKGQGVVYTVTLPTLDRSAKVETVRSVSEWESVRREFRKEKQPPKKSDEVGLREVLLKVLAENGRHFSRLGENESLTIVVTVHEENKPQPSRKSEAKPANSGSKPTLTARTLIDSATGSSKAHDLELLGDLHLKQGRSADAIAALQKALEMASGSKQKAALHRKLAQAYLMQEKNDEARSHIDRAIAFLKEATDAKNNSAPASKPEATPLPVKMIIAVPKKLLDQASDGKMAFEEFCRRASVETLRFEEAQR
jgi:tetratricopeptide (TPR) repeat protein